MRRLSVYVAVFLVGFGIMGFEMVVSRLMVPWFGSGIDTWAALISTVLTGLTLGYFAGGAMPLRWRSPARVGGVIMAAAFLMALAPAVNVTVFRAISARLGDGALTLMVSSVLICFLPVLLLGTFAPRSVDLLARLGTADGPGAIAGRLYGVSTLGSVCGTLCTAFVLIPAMGSDNIALALAAMCFVAGGMLWASGRAEEADAA